MLIRIDLNEPQIIQKVTSDEFGLMVSNEWKRLIDPYTPRDNGILEQGARIRPFEIEYIQKYSHYVYEGRLYVDPDYKIAAFYDPIYGFWSRPNIKIINSNRPLKYQKKNPYATDHWDIKAAEAGQLDKLYQTINNALQNNRV